MQWRFYTISGELKGKGNKGDAGPQGPPVYVDQEGPEGPEMFYPIKGDKGDTGDRGPQGPLPPDPDAPDEPLLIVGPVGPRGSDAPPPMMPFDPEPPDEPIIVVGPQGLKGDPAPVSVIPPPDPDTPDEPIMLPGPPGDFGNSTQDTTPLALTNPGVSSKEARDDHTHQSPGGIAARTSTFTLANNGAATDIVSAQLPTNFLKVGTTFRFRLSGTVQVATNSGTLAFLTFIGATAAGQSFQMPSQVAAAGPVAFTLEVLATVRSVGAGGTYITSGYGRIEFATPVALTTTDVTTTGVDTTAATPTVKMQADWQTASASNSLIVTEATIEVVKM